MRVVERVCNGVLELVVEKVQPNHHYSTGNLYTNPARQPVWKIKLKYYLNFFFMFFTNKLN